MQPCVWKERETVSCLRHSLLFYISLAARPSARLSESVKMENISFVFAFFYLENDFVWAQDFCTVSLSFALAYDWSGCRFEPGFMPSRTFLRVEHSILAQRRDMVHILQFIMTFFSVFSLDFVRAQKMPLPSQTISQKICKRNARDIHFMINFATRKITNAQSRTAHVCVYRLCVLVCRMPMQGLTATAVSAPKWDRQFSM